MKCLNCGFDNTENSIYCNNCGVKLNSEQNNIVNNNQNNFQTISTATINANIKQKNNLGLLAILILGLLAFICIFSLTYISFTTSGSKSTKKTETYYENIVGEWIDSSEKNYLIISDNSLYNWYQNYRQNKNDYLEGSTKVTFGNDALQEMNLDLNKIKQLLNIEDIDESNIYCIKLYTSKKDIKYSYYKMLVVTRDNELYAYNFNDKLTYIFTRR